MSQLRQKISRLRLPSAEYQDLRDQVLKRDGWRCQLCGTSKELHIHHPKSRGRLGDDAMHNLITLCAKCHDAVHGRTGKSQIPVQEFCRTKIDGIQRLRLNWARYLRMRLEEIRNRQFSTRCRARWRGGDRANVYSRGNDWSHSK